MTEDTHLISGNGRDADLDLAELRCQAVRHIALALALIAAAVGLVTLPGFAFNAVLFWVLFTLFLSGYGAFRFCESRPRLGEMVLAVGLISVFALGLHRIRHPGVPYMGTIAVFLLAAVRLWLGAVSAGVISFLIVFFQGWGIEAILPVTSAWIALGCQWVSSRAVYTVLSWAWASQERANQLLRALREQQGEQARTLAALTEATRRLQRTGYQLHIARVRADELREIKANFAANISHELRTPLNLILGFSETMYFTPEVYGDMTWPVSLRRDVSHIYQASRQLSDLLNDVLDLSRIDTVQMPVRKEWTSLKQIVDDALDTVRHLVKSDSVSMYAVVPDDLPDLLIDRVRIRQVLINLLNNAARFTSRGEISVRVQVGAEECVVSVRDTGIGMPPDELEKVFDVFHQVDLSLRRGGGGTGLGLGISKRFVELHGGRMWAESIEGKGSTFFFSVPRAPEDLPPALVESAPQRWMRNIPEPAVLVVDPDPSVAERLAAELPEFQVVKARDVTEALELIERWGPSAIVVNQSPRIKGLGSIARQLYAAVDELVPVVACSIPSEGWLAEEAGVLGALTKPISRHALVAQLERLNGVRDVLVVDDDRSFVQLMQRYLESEGCYEVRGAYEASEALREIRRKRPDLMLVDLAMPDMSGLELLARIHENATEGVVPTIIVTATDYGRVQQAEEGSFIGLARRQPYGTTEIALQVRSLLEFSQQIGLEPPSKPRGAVVR